MGTEDNTSRKFPQATIPNVGAKSDNTDERSDVSTTDNKAAIRTPFRNATINKKRQNTKVIEPKENDVLFGRGGAINNHEGNVLFRRLVLERKMSYNLQTNTKSDKSKISQDVVATIKKLNGRFLTRAECPTSGTVGLGGLWVEVEDSKAMSKTSQALREGAPILRAEAEGKVPPNNFKGKQRLTSQRGLTYKQSPKRSRNQLQPDLPSDIFDESPKSKETFLKITSMVGSRGKCLISCKSEEDLPKYSEKVPEFSTTSLEGSEKSTSLDETEHKDSTPSLHNAKKSRILLNPLGHRLHSLSVPGLIDNVDLTENFEDPF